MVESKPPLKYTTTDQMLMDVETSKAAWIFAVIHVAVLGAMAPGMRYFQIEPAWIAVILIIAAAGLITFQVVVVAGSAWARIDHVLMMLNQISDRR
jgi:hypothetical protein